MLLHAKTGKIIGGWDVFEIDDDCLRSLLVKKNEETGKESLSELAKSKDGEILVKPHIPLCSSYDIDFKEHNYYFLDSIDDHRVVCEEFRMSRKDFTSLIKETGIKSIFDDIKKGK